MASVESVRMDKWLWASRFFKTRAFAADSCDLGRIHSNGHLAKAARDVRVGDMLRIKNEAGEFLIEVLALSSVRGPATTAQTLYRETEASKFARAEAETVRKALAASDFPMGKPNKKDRRLINKARGRIIGF